MAAQEFKNLDAYETFIKNKIATWTPGLRAALAAGMAERWLPVYQDFSTTEGWGDPAFLRRSLDEVWAWVSSRQPSGREWSRLSRQIHDVTPHMDDFDANEALCTCVMVQYALECCTKKDTLTPALMGVLSGLEAVLPDILDEERVPARLWHQAAFRKEIQNELRLIETLGALADETRAYETLAPLLADPEIVGVVQPRQAPVGPSNEHAFEQYRQITLMDIKGAASGLDPRNHPEFATTLYIAAWMRRYGRRKQMISGEYGALADQAAVQKLVLKNHAMDQAEAANAIWDPAARETIDMIYQNPYNGLDAPTPESPHGYGPSLRRLWVKAKRQGLTDQQAWDNVEEWANHQPEAWAKKGKQEKKQAMLNLQAFQENLNQKLTWKETGDPQVPWATQVGEALWQVRLNDFPDEVMYSLLVKGEETGDFHDWPPSWQRV